MTRRQNKKKAVEYMGGQCELCGYNDDPKALEFHHIDPATKSFKISGYRGSWESLREELDKCVMLCANCHRKQH